MASAAPLMLAAMPKEPTQKRTVTPENREESARLKRIWEAKEDRPSQMQFGHDYDIGNQAAVGFFLNGQSALSLKAAKGFAKGLGCHIGDFSPRLAAEIAEYAQYTGIGWPFPMVDRTRWEQLTPELRGYVQAATVRALEECIAAEAGHAWTPQAAAGALSAASEEARRAAVLIDTVPAERRGELLAHLNSIRSLVAQGMQVQFTVAPSAEASSQAAGSPSPTAKRGRSR